MTYFVLRLILRLYLPLYFREIRVEGLENVPRDKMVIFVANHQNAFLDAILIALRLPIPIHMLVRADVFKSHLLKAIFKQLHLIPIFRSKDLKLVSKEEKLKIIRDQNQGTFDRASDELDDGDGILIFPEGESDTQYDLSPIKKGFFRLAQIAINKYPNKELALVPVTVNYSNHTEGNSRIWIKYLEPLTVTTKSEAADVVSKVNTQLRQNMFIGEKENVSSILQRSDFSPSNLEEAIRSVEKLSAVNAADSSHQEKKRNHFFWLSLMSKFYYLPSLLLINWTVKKVPHDDFKLSIRSLGLILFGFTQCLFLTIFVFYFFSAVVGLLFIVSNLVLFILAAKGNNKFYS